jgi:hypothetical protein
MGVEADIWLKSMGNGSEDLLVGHHESALTAARTLRSLYIEPLFQVLERQNPRNNMAMTNDTARRSGINGIYDMDPEVSMALLIDFKTEPNAIWPVLMAQLTPLREKDWLTRYDESSQCRIERPITVVVTGNAEFSQVVFNVSNPHRDIFFDAPLDKLDAIENSPLTQYSNRNCLYASVSFQNAIGKMRGWKLSSEQLQRLRNQIRSAKERGLLARYWDTPAWPVLKRDYVWDVLVAEGVGMLSVDKLDAAVKEKW